MTKKYKKNALYLVAEAKLLSLGKHCFLPFFVSVIKNKNIIQSM